LFAIRRSRPGDVVRVIDIWRGAVDATHDFLTAADREEIDAAACAYLARALLWVVIDRTDQPMAFSAVTGSNMDALFVSAGRLSASASHATSRSVLNERQADCSSSGKIAASACVAFRRRRMGSGSSALASRPMNTTAEICAERTWRIPADSPRWCHTAHNRAVHRMAVPGSCKSRASLPPHLWHAHSLQRPAAAFSHSLCRAPPQTPRRDRK